MSTKKKRHHYVPISYLKAFCDEREMLTVYRKDTPTSPYRAIPDEVAFQKYYYAQPLPDGGRDTNRLEDRFGELEDKWPLIVRAIEERLPINDRLDDLFAFVALQRARVPAAREAAERMLAASVMATAKQLDAAGMLPPPPLGMESILDKMCVSINPHQSIHAMIQIIRGMGAVLDRVGIVIVHNRSATPFVTSDNPVIYFDPGVSNDNLRPYALQASGHAVVMMPVSPRLMLYGTSWDKPRFVMRGVEYTEVADAGAISLLNEKVCRFAYETVYANSPSNEEMILRYASLSPVLKTTTLPLTDGQGVVLSWEFGERTKLPKWKS